MIASNPLVNEFLFLHSSNGILIANSAGEIEQVNPAGAALLDVAVDLLIGSTVQKSFGNNTALLGLFTRPGEQVLDVRLPRRRLAAGISNTLADGRRIVLLQDVTEQRELDSRREAF